MPDEQNDHRDTPLSMHHREITLADGRYMIFYTFDEADSSADENSREDPGAIEKDNDV